MYVSVCVASVFMRSNLNCIFFWYSFVLNTDSISCHLNIKDYDDTFVLSRNIDLTKMEYKIYKFTFIQNIDVNGLINHFETKYVE